MVRDLCVKYVLPSPQSLLKFPMPKDKYKNLVKSRIIDFWECHLRTEANKLSHHSLQYFKQRFMSLTCPHLLWTSCGSNAFEIHKQRYSLELMWLINYPDTGPITQMSYVASLVAQDIPSALLSNYFCPVLPSKSKEWNLTILPLKLLLRVKNVTMFWAVSLVRNMQKWYNFYLIVHPTH